MGFWNSQINTCRKVPLQVNFFRARHFALPYYKEYTVQYTCIYSSRGSVSLTIQHILHNQSAGLHMLDQ
jgi:hypothetical protein